MSNRNERTTSSNEELFLRGEVVSLEEGSVRVRLESGEIGSLMLSSQGGELPTLQIGQRAMFCIERQDTEKGLILSIAPVYILSEKTPFEQEVDRLHHALANHQRSNSYHRTLLDFLEEDRIQQWIAQVEESLVRLRKHRTHRLNEEFYNS